MFQLNVISLNIFVARMFVFTDVEYRDSNRICFIRSMY